MDTMLRRARPWLGTLVEMRLEGLNPASAAMALDAAFAEVAAVHRCMSFHDADSDLSRLHRADVGSVVTVDARTYEVLRCAVQVAAMSEGSFDPCVGARAVAHGALPRPRSAFVPDPAASWHDIEFPDVDRVRLRRGLWLDLGGIAKGYAVDRAIGILRAAGAVQAIVNAGGDLRVAGTRAERVHLRIHPGEVAHTIELSDGAIASSTSSSILRTTQTTDGALASGEDTATGVSVAAPSCMLADALTKVALVAQPRVAARALAAFGAQALCYHAAHGRWCELGVTA